MGKGIKKSLIPIGTKLTLRGTTQIRRGQTLRTHFPITEAKPAAHFLAAAPGRTPQRLTNRLPADGRSSLGKAMIAELPVQSILTLHLYHIPPELARENCKKTQKGRTRRVRP